MGRWGMHFGHGSNRAMQHPLLASRWVLGTEGALWHCWGLPLTSVALAVQRGLACDELCPVSGLRFFFPTCLLGSLSPPCIVQARPAPPADKVTSPAAAAAAAPVPASEQAADAEPAPMKEDGGAAEGDKENGGEPQLVGVLG